MQAVSEVAAAVRRYARGAAPNAKSRDSSQGRGRGCVAAVPAAAPTSRATAGAELPPGDPISASVTHHIGGRSVHESLVENAAHSSTHGTHTCSQPPPLGRPPEGFPVVGVSFPGQGWKARHLPGLGCGFPGMEAGLGHGTVGGCVSVPGRGFPGKVGERVRRDGRRPPKVWGRLPGKRLPVLGSGRRPSCQIIR